jgi:alcohol dehydrogenase class IV
LAKEFGDLALVLTGTSIERIEYLVDVIHTSNVKIVHYPVDKEPTVDIVRRGVNLGVSSGCQLVIAIGGGSVMDAAKAIAILMTNEGDIFDYLEVIGKG